MSIATAVPDADVKIARTPAGLSRPALVALHLVVGLGGTGVALSAAWISRAAWRPDGLTLPWGIALSLAGSVSAVWLARAGATSLGFVAAAGWLTGVAVLLVVRPGGDLLLISDTYGNTFLLAGAVAVIATAAWGSLGR
ncbi:MAG: hypothetical protein H0T17_09425 [Propionibacteriales bacterium]|nr:hypothetical protein [Propionibacteriales bacterium]